MARFLIVPQWQGSASSRAMAHIDGAEAIAGDLPSRSCTRVDVPLEAGESIGTGVLRASTLRRVGESVREKLAAPDLGDGEHTIVVGGDAGVAVPAAGHLASDDLAVLWLGAHAGLCTASPSTPVAFETTALRSLLGHGDPAFSLRGGAIAPSRVVLAGARALEDEEAAFVEDSGIRHLAGDALTPDRVAEAVRETGASRVFIHVALDVLDPAHVDGVIRPEPFGADPADVVAVIAAVRESLPLAGAALTGFAPSSPAAAVSDMGTILRLIGALAR